MREGSLLLRWSRIGGDRDVKAVATLPWRRNQLCPILSAIFETPERVFHFGNCSSFDVLGPRVDPAEAECTRTPSGTRLLVRLMQQLNY